MTDLNIETVRVRVQPDGRISRADAAKFLDRAPKTLATWKSEGVGPRTIMVGGRVFYDWAEIQAIARGEQLVRPQVA